MIPWPIALVALMFGLDAAFASVDIWRLMTGTSHGSVVWSVVRLGVDVSIACGLPLRKAWARLVAMVASGWLMVLGLALSTSFVALGRPVGALVATIAVSPAILAIVYLRRPAVKAWFSRSDEVAR